MRWKDLNSYEAVEKLLKKEDLRLKVSLEEKKKYHSRTLIEQKILKLKLPLLFNEDTPANSLVVLRDRKQGFVTVETIPEARLAGEKKEYWFTYSDNSLSAEQQDCEVFVLRVEVQGKRADLKTFKR